MSSLKSLSYQFSVLGRFWQEKNNSRIFRWNIIIIGIQLAYLILNFNGLPPQVPLYYSLPWGESQLANATVLFLIPTFSIVVVLINSLLAAFFLHTIQLLSRLLVVSSLIFSSLMLITLLHIIILIS